jgi:hypothetical protein
MSTMQGPLLAEDGAEFEATIEKTPEDVQAHYLVMCDAAASVRTESDTRLFVSEDKARLWLGQAAMLRGFQYPPTK